MKPTVSLREAFADRNLLGHVLAGNSWLGWKTLLIAAMGEQLTDGERELFAKLTGREREPLQRVKEFEAVAGRRAGKTSAMAAAATYVSACCDHGDALARGETGVCLCVAQDQRVAKKILDFVEANLEDSTILRQLIKGRSQDTIELANGINVEVRPASFRKLRGPSYICVICDELAFWYVDDVYANPDSEVIAAARPGLLTTRGPLIMASSPYAKRGVLWDNYRKHYGSQGAPLILVAKGTTRDFNATIPQEEIERELERDRARNTAELLAEFRSDLETYVDIAVVEGCVGGHREMLPAAGTFYYSAFCDPASGSGQDSFTCAVAHKKSDGEIIIDAVREFRPFFSPSAVIDDLAILLKSYRIWQISGDHFAGEFPRELFRQQGICYEVCKSPKSDLYRDLLPLLNSGRIVLPRNDRLVTQIVGLERRVTRAGKDSIDHAPNAHDDVANCVAGVAAVLHSRSYYNIAALAS